MSAVQATESPATKLVGDLEALESSRRFTRDQLETIYTIAYNLFTSGKFDEALGYFAFLTLYRPTEQKYLRGLAASQQQLKNYEGAIQSYSFLTMLNPEDPTSTLRIGECLMMSGQVADARDALSMVVSYTKASGTHTPQKARAEALLSVLEKVKS